jgi:hypothetical protein
MNFSTLSNYNANPVGAAVFSDAGSTLNMLQKAMGPNAAITQHTMGGRNGLLASTSLPEYLQVTSPDTYNFIFNEMDAANKQLLEIVEIIPVEPNTKILTSHTVIYGGGTYDPTTDLIPGTNLSSQHYSCKAFLSQWNKAASIDWDFLCQEKGRQEYLRLLQQLALSYSMTLEHIVLNTLHSVHDIFIKEFGKLPGSVIRDPLLLADDFADQFGVLRKGENGANHLSSMIKREENSRGVSFSRIIAGQGFVGAMNHDKQYTSASDSGTNSVTTYRSTLNNIRVTEIRPTLNNNDEQINPLSNQVVFGQWMALTHPRADVQDFKKRYITITDLANDSTQTFSEQELATNICFDLVDAGEEKNLSDGKSVDYSRENIKDSDFLIFRFPWWECSGCFAVLDKNIQLALSPPTITEGLNVQQRYSGQEESFEIPVLLLIFLMQMSLVLFHTEVVPLLIVKS